MNNKNQNTQEILSAIRDMMGKESIDNEQPLPKDVLELTESAETNDNETDNNVEILELTQLVSDAGPIEDSDDSEVQESTIETEEDNLRMIIRESIKNHASDKIDLIIKEEMQKIIKEKLNKAQVVIDTGDKI